MIVAGRLFHALVVRRYRPTVQVLDSLTPMPFIHVFLFALYEIV